MEKKKKEIKNKISKKYALASKKLVKEAKIAEAIDAVKKASYSKFEGTIELKINLNIDPKDSEQNVRFITELPHPTGRKRVVLVFSESKLSKSEFNTIEILEGTDEVLEKVIAGKLSPKKEFDIVVTDAKNMPKLAKAAKVLGPKGAMPSPKTGTVGDVEKILANLDKGQIEVRSQPSNKVVHMVLGNVKTDTNAMAENFNALITELNKHKPAKVKKGFIQSVYVSATMSPSVKVIVE